MYGVFRYIKAGYDELLSQEFAVLFLDALDYIGKSSKKP
jgi:hypothetical protein